MTLAPAPARALWLALLIPAALYGGALVSQYGFGLFPCEMCYWQRWPHQTAIVLALLALLLRRQPASRIFVVLAALAIAVSGAIGVFHAGVEYKWWAGLTACTTSPIGGGSGDFMRDIMASPVIACDVPQWTLAGISLAGFNAFFSLGGAALILWCLRKAR